MVRNFLRQSLALNVAIGIGVSVGVLLIASGSYAWYYAERAMPHTYIGIHPVGGLTRDEAALRIEKNLEELERTGVPLIINGASESIRLEEIGLDLNVSGAVDAAFARGRTGSAFTQFRERVVSLWRTMRLDAPVVYDETALADQVGDIADLSDIARRDVRFQVKGATIGLATDTAVGRIVDRTEAVGNVAGALRTLDASPIELQLHDDPPRADPVMAQNALVDARKVVARSLTLVYEDLQYFISRERIATWLVSEYPSDQLSVGLDNEAISAYVTTIAAALNIPAEPAHITTDAGRVIGFTPPKVGRAVQEEKLVRMVIDTILSRASAKPAGDILVIPLKSSSVSLTGLDAGSGITELIGKATTPFTGSPRNRISNIKNGVKFLTGTIVPAGAEFSTLGTLGIIDNTTGYLPELVIKGDRTTPEFGGGLCQVSTTLFRSVMNAGLPVTSRRNHSYRVSYYEKDGNGKVIGPGLDATIYQPDVDFRFLNDTSHPILIIGYVAGDKLTFELYGTRDGRTSTIDGPYTLTETPAGEPVYIDDSSLAVGVKKQVEFPHPGGSAVATYSITYPDGTVKSQEFRSWYRRWPAKYLVGTGGAISPSPSPSVTP